MLRYEYFVKRTYGYHSFVKKFQCIRLPEGDPRTAEYARLYYPIGWRVLIPYYFKPTQEDEIFQLKLKFIAWDADVEIIDPDTKPEKEMS